MRNKVNPSQLSSDLADMRRAYRVLVPFQEMMKNTLLYIKEQYRFNDNSYGVKLYPFGAFVDNVISTSGAEAIEVTFNNDTFFKSVNFTGCSSVLFGGPSVFSHKRKHNQVAALWGFIIPDDRLIMNRLQDDILNIQDAENASGYIVLFAFIDNDCITEDYYNVGDCLAHIEELMMDDDAFEKLYTNIRKLLSSRSDKKIMSNGDEMSILKRYCLEEFADKQSTDRVLRDFAKLVLDKIGLKIFKEPFYERSTPSTKRR